MPTSPFTDDFIPEFVVYQADPSSHDFTPAFYAAINKFHKITGNSLDTHPFAKQLDTCQTPQQVLNALQTQLTPFSKLRILNQRERLMGRLDPIVRIVHMLSEMLEQCIGLSFSPAKKIFTAIGILLRTVRDFVASYSGLSHIFDKIYFCLLLLKVYSMMPLTRRSTVLLGEIMTQLLSVFAFSINVMTECRIKTILKKRRKGVEIALSQLDVLTKEGGLMLVETLISDGVNVNGVFHGCDGNAQIRATKVLIEEIKRQVNKVQNC